MRFDRSSLHADLLTFPTDRGDDVAVPPLTFSTVLDGIPGIERSQIVQSTPATLRVRLRLFPGVDRDATDQAVRSDLERLLAEHGLGNVSVELGDEPPEQSVGGKYRATIPLSR